MYKVVKNRLEHLKQSISKPPPEVVDNLGQDLNADLKDPDTAVQRAGSVLNKGMRVASITQLVSSALVNTGVAAADGIIADLGAVASDFMPVLVVAEFGLSLYNGITELKHLKDAIKKVNKKRQDAENAVAKIKAALDGLLTAGFSVVCRPGFCWT